VGSGQRAATGLAVGLARRGGWLALDIGGANLKAADGRRFAHSKSFPLWKNPAGLAAALAELIAECPAADRYAVTMTGELADCFETKAAGVRAILDAVVQIVDESRVRVYLTDGELVSVDLARENAVLAAASNWHALAAFAYRFLDGRPGMLIDIGSTTCDLIPLTTDGPVAKGRTDPERLAAGELVYTGVERSPVCAVTRTLPWRGLPCPVAQELFATTVDAYLTLGQIAENAGNIDTADGRPRTIAAARDRLARMVCADRTMFSFDDAVQAAATIRDAQLSMLADAFRAVVARQPAPPEVLVLSGGGEFLGRLLVKQVAPRVEFVSLIEQLGAEASRCGPAHALAVLAAEYDDGK
jgi:hypothetical protein